MKVTKTEIATRCMVGVSAVSNWESRYDDFPDVVEMSSGGIRPVGLYDWAEVEGWLIGKRKRKYGHPVFGGKA